MFCPCSQAEESYYTPLFGYNLLYSQGITRSNHVLRANLVCSNIQEYNKYCCPVLKKPAQHRVLSKALKIL